MTDNETVKSHDEVMAWIDDQKGENCLDSNNYPTPCNDCCNCASYNANRAVLERHKPKQLGPIKYPNGTLYCSECFTDQGHDGAFPVSFPCPSYTEIYAPIRSVM